MNAELRRMAEEAMTRTQLTWVGNDAHLEAFARAVAEDCAKYVEWSAVGATMAGQHQYVEALMAIKKAIRAKYGIKA